METMKTLEGTELVLHISGEMAVKSNIHDYHLQLKEALAGINMELVTDSDFAEAELTIKSCDLIETQIANKRQDALMKNKVLAEIVTISEIMQEEVRQVRLSLNKLVKTEKENRKTAIVNNGRKSLIGLAEKSPVKHGFSIDFAAIQNAVKGKRSLSAMEEAVNQVVEQERERLEILERLFSENMSIIETYELEHIGLAPDKKTLALNPSEIIETEMTNRILKRKIAAQEKAEAERKAKEEQERIAKELEEKSNEIQASNTTAEKTEILLEGYEKPFVVPPLPDNPFSSASFGVTPEENFTLTVKVKTRNISSVIEQIRREIDGFVSVNIQLS